MCLYLYICINHSKECITQRSLCSSVSLLSVKILMEGTYDMPYKKSIFLCDYWTKSDGVFAEMQMISYSFVIIKNFQIKFTIVKDIDLENPIVIFWTIGIMLNQSRAVKSFFNPFCTNCVFLSFFSHSLSFIIVSVFCHFYVESLPFMFVDQ